MNDPVELTVKECLELLHGGVVGRVAMCTPMGPRIVPLNYAMYGDAIIIRTTPYSELGTYGWKTDLAFEIDHLDYENHTGWSVVAIGRAHMVDDPDELHEIRESWEPRPWARGQRNLYLKVAWHDISGRSLGAHGSPSSMTPVRRTV